MVTPTFVHATASDLNDNNGIVGNSFIFSPANASQAGNTLLLAVAYPFSAGRTRAVADSTTASWGSPIGTAGTASTGHMNLAIYALPNVAAALHILTYTFDTQLKPFWYEIVEFYNVAAASPADGFQGQVVTGPNISAGSYTPSTNNDANGGHLIFTVAISDDTVGTGINTQSSAMSATGGATPIHFNNVCTIPQMSSYQVQATNGPINPGFSVTQASTTDFVVASVALKAGASGSDLPAGIKVRKIIHYTFVNLVAGNNLFLFPCMGNLRVGTMAANDGINHVNSFTDTAGVTYAPRAASGQSQIFDTGSLTSVSPSTSLGINIDITGQQDSLHLWDVADAAPNAFDTSAGFQGAAPSNTTVNDFPDITPGVSHGLTIMQSGLGTASQGSLAAGAPPNAVFDCVSYTTPGAFDPDRMDNADPFAHVVFLTAAPQTWNVHITSASFGSTAFCTAVTYKSAPASTPGDPPSSSVRYLGWYN